VTPRTALSDNSAHVPARKKVVGNSRHSRHADTPRLAFSLDEAAAALGVSKDFFDEHVRPELRVVRRGRRILVSTLELSRWLEASSARTLE
jgi:excisionase family DNA binding protein